MKILRGWVPVLVVAGVLVALVQADAAHLKENARKHKIVYQLDDAGVDKAKFVLGNIRNHVSGVGGWQNVESLELVVFGPALKSFVQMEPALLQMLVSTLSWSVLVRVVAGFGSEAIAGYVVCMRIVIFALQGGVVRIMELQEHGYIYLRP